MASHVEDCENSDIGQNLMTFLQEYMEARSANSSVSATPAGSPLLRPTDVAESLSPQQRLFSMLNSVLVDRPRLPPDVPGADSMDHRLLEAEAEIQRLRSQMEQKERQMHVLVEGMVKSVKIKHSEHQREVSVLKDEIRAKHDEVGKCRSDFQDIAEENHKLKTEDMPNLKAEHFASMTELERVKADFARAMRLEQNCGHLASENERLKQVIDMLQDWKRNAESKLQKDAAHINHQAEQVQQHQAAVQGLRDELKQQESTHAELRAKAATAEEALQRLQQEQKGQLTMASDLALARQALQARDAELTAVTEQHQATLQAVRVEHQQQIAAHLKRQDSISAELQAKAATAEEALRRSNEEQKCGQLKMDKDLALARSDLQARHAELAVAKAQHAQVSAELAKANEEHQRSNAQHDDELAKAKAAHQLSCTQHADLADELAKIKKAHQDVIAHAANLLREMGVEEPSGDSAAGIEKVFCILRDFANAGAKAPVGQTPAATLAANSPKWSREASFAEKVHHFASVRICVPPAPSRSAITPSYRIMPPTSAIRAA